MTEVIHVQNVEMWMNEWCQTAKEHWVIPLLIERKMERGKMEESSCIYTPNMIMKSIYQINKPKKSKIITACLCKSCCHKVFQVDFCMVIGSVLLLTSQKSQVILGSLNVTCSLNYKDQVQLFRKVIARLLVKLQIWGIIHAIARAVHVNH